MTINRDAKIEINLNELVAIRASFLGEDLEESDIEDLASDLRYRLTFDTIYQMIDSAIYEYLDKSDTHYGEIQTGVIPKPEFKMVKLSSPSGSWEIDVPIRV